MRKIAFLLLLFVSFPALAQTPARFDLPVLTTTPDQVPVGSLPNLLAVTNATISVCQYPATLTNGMCTNTITTYTDSTLSSPCPSTAQLTAPGTSVCISTSGLQGGFGFWYNSATQTHLTYTIQTSWGTFGPFDILQGGGGSGSGSVTNFSSGNLTPLFTTSVANGTTTPTQSYTASTFSAHTFYGNNGSSTATPGANLLGVSDWSPNAYVAGSGSAQVQTITLVPAATALTAGLEVRWFPIAANTATAPTLNVNSLGAKVITKLGTTALAANDLTTTAVADAIYDGTRWQLQNPQTNSGSGGSGINQLTGDGTAGPGTGSQVLTLATVNSSPGACGDATHVCQVTTNAKGLTTAQTAVAITGSASSWSGLTNPTGNLSLTMGVDTSTFANTPVFTNSQMNQNWILNGGGLNFLTEFQIDQPTFFGSEDLSVGLVVPSSSAIHQTETIGAYTTNASTSTNAVAGYFSGHAKATSASVWGMNAIIDDGGFSSGSSGFRSAGEFDCDLTANTTNGACIDINGTLGNMTKYPALQILTNSAGFWSSDINLGDASSPIAINIGATSSATSSPSMPIQFTRIGTAPARISAKIYYDANDRFNFGDPIYVAATNSPATNPLITAIGPVGLESWKDATPTFALALGFEVPNSGTPVNNPTFSYYNGSSWASAWSVNSSNGNFNTVNEILSPSAAFGSSGQATVDTSGDVSTTGFISSPNFTSAANSGYPGFSVDNATSSPTGAYEFGIGHIGETADGVATKWFIFDSINSKMRMAGDLSGNVNIGYTTPYPTTFSSLFSVGTGSQFQVDGSGNTSVTPTAAATSGANVNSPNMTWTGHYWNGTVSGTDSWVCFDDLSQWTGSPTNAISILTCNHAGSSGGSEFKVPMLSAATINSANIVSFAAAGVNALGVSVTTPATSSANFGSPVFTLSGSLWNGSLGVNDVYFFQDIIPGTGTNPNTVLTLGHSGTSGKTSVDFSAATSFKAAEYFGPASAPSGSCTDNGAWVFSQDGHATFCASGTWATKI